MGQKQNGKYKSQQRMKSHWYVCRVCEELKMTLTLVWKRLDLKTKMHQNSLDGVAFHTVVIFCDIQLG